MSAFGQGLQFGLLQGMYNNMFGFCGFGGFGGFWGNPFGCFNNFGFMGGGFFNYSPLNFFSTSMFCMPTFTGCSSFYQYPYPQTQFPAVFNSVFNQPQPLSFSNVSLSSTNNTDTFVSSTAAGTSGVNSSLTRTPAPVTPSANNTNNTSTVTKITDNNQSSVTRSKVEKPDSDKKYTAASLKEKWQKKSNLKLNDKFYEKIIAISNRIECNPDDLMGVISIETGGTFSPSVQNASTGATGLIQFMPKYVSSYGTTIEDLKHMTAEDQLDYVEIYLVKNKKAKNLNGKLDAGTLYALVFYPALTSGAQIKKGDAAYNQNKGLDINNDGMITLDDLSEKVKRAQV